LAIARWCHARTWSDIAVTGSLQLLERDQEMVDLTVVEPIEPNAFLGSVLEVEDPILGAGDGRMDKALENDGEFLIVAS